MNWRWDQGRLECFSFYEIQRIAKGLVNFDGMTLAKRGNGVTDPLRALLLANTPLVFKPVHKDYPVWRNHGRVFGCQMLAAKVGGTLVCTDLCKAVASNRILCDEYLTHVARRLYFSSPVFAGYTGKGKQIFPICAIIKLLVANFISHAKPMLSIDEIADFIKGNSLDGTEPLANYGALKSTGVRFGSEERRQVREMFIFFSQFSFLKWRNGNLFLDVGLPEEAKAIAHFFQPIQQPRKLDASQELLQLGGNVAVVSSVVVSQSGAGLDVLDQEFAEGSKLRVTHLRVERSAKLKEFYFANAADPHACDVCTMDTRKHYPWTIRLVELHHVLPLAAPINFGKKSTSLKDVVGLCPSCHRATHKYYSTWLKGAGVKDFQDRAEAQAVYRLAKDTYVP
jgi:hypothetical protein